MAADNKKKPVRWKTAGYGLIGWGAVGGVYEYLRDANSDDIFAIGYAQQGAWLHFFLWSIVGVVLIVIGSAAGPQPPADR